MYVKEFLLTQLVMCVTPIT